MGLPLPLATCLSWVGPSSNLGGGVQDTAMEIPKSEAKASDIGCAQPGNILD
jgi:hypothetical protein